MKFLVKLIYEKKAYRMICRLFNLFKGRALADYFFSAGAGAGALAEDIGA